MRGEVVLSGKSRTILVRSLREGFFGGVFCLLLGHPRDVLFCRFRWHPRGAFAARALPLCGAALTFFAAAKKVSKESGLTPPILDVGRELFDVVLPLLFRGFQASYFM
jgi:hypothetical protein